MKKIIFGILIITSFTGIILNSDTVHGNPTDSITIDKGTVDEYVLPKDSLPTSLLEHSDYVQGANELPILRWDVDKTAAVTSQYKVAGDEEFIDAKIIDGYSNRVIVAMNLSNYAGSINYKKESPGGGMFLLVNEKGVIIHKITYRGIIGTDLNDPTLSRFESVLLQEKDLVFSAAGQYNSKKVKYQVRYDPNTDQLVREGINNNPLPAYATYSPNRLGIGDETGEYYSGQIYGYSKAISFPGSPSESRGHLGKYFPIASVEKGQIGYLVNKTLEEVTKHKQESTVPGLTETLAKIETGSMHRFQNKLAVIIKYSASGEGNLNKKYSSIQIFNDSENAKTFVKEVLPATTEQELFSAEGLSTNEHYYYYSKNSKGVLSFNKYELSSDITSKIIEFPAGSESVSIKKNKYGKFQFIGYISEATGAFANKNVPIGGGFVTGTIDQEGFVDSVVGVQTKSGLDISGTIILSEQGHMFTWGRTTPQYSSIMNLPLWEGMTTRTEEWKNKKYPYYTILESMIDTSPLIRKGKVIELNRDNQELNSTTKDEYNRTPIEQLLITGSIGGKPSDELSMFVKDEYDNNFNLFVGDTEAERILWLDKRINRNPNNLELPIDWESLGFRKNITGNQLVSYFVVDSQNQSTVISRQVNVVTNHTVKNDSHALDVQNFAISLSDVQSGVLATDDVIKEKAKTTAWSLTDMVMAEKGENKVFSSKVIFTDTNQLSVLRAATEAKPYPVDIEYSENGVVLKNRIWVFVTADNTTVNDTNGVVLYASNYSYPLQRVSTTSANKQIQSIWKNTQPNLVAYDYYSATLTGEVLEPLSAGSVDGSSKGLNMEGSDLTRIQQTDQLVDLPNIQFTYTRNGTVTKVPVVVTIYKSEAKLNIEFVNEANQPLHIYDVNLDVNLDDIVDLTKNLEVQDQINKIEADGYTILSRPVNESSVMINEMSVKIEYKVQGVISLSSAPTTIDFGAIAHEATTKRVDNPSLNKKLIVTDTRVDARTGFKVTATLSKPMTNKDGEKLENAVRFYYKGTEKVLDANAQEVYINTTGTNGSHSVSDSWGDTKDTDGLKLQLNASDKVYTGEYTGVITWKVMAGQP